MGGTPQARTQTTARSQTRMRGKKKQEYKPPPDPQVKSYIPPTKPICFVCGKEGEVRCKEHGPIWPV